MLGKVVKKNANQFLVNGRWCVARGNLKDQGIFVGDDVVCDDRENVIEKVCERKNVLVRPPIANIDKMIIVIAPVPKPDFLLIDKLLIFCEKNEIIPVICVNKCDILDKTLKNQIISIYSNIAKIIMTSAKNDDCKELASQIKGVCTFAGQSAVGKSSLINALHGQEVEQVGDLAKKVERGKQTTRMVSLYKLGEDDYIADTAGFSKLDEGLLDIDERKLANYYPDFVPYLNDCEYSSCTHTKEKKCGIAAAAKRGDIALVRYENYLKLYDAIKERRRK